jgi:hypothetical protein
MADSSDILPQNDETALETLKQNIIEYIRLQLGDEIIDIELDAAHYQAAYSAAISTYRQRAANAYEEAYIFMELVTNINIYTLPQEVQSVRTIYRRSFGDSTGPYASNFDPFSQASMNVYLMNFNVAGGLATYDFYSQYVEQAGRMFGAFMNYTFNKTTKKLQLIRAPKGTGEQVLLWVYQMKPEIELLSDPLIKQWIRNFMFGNCKVIIGEARELFSTIAGPQGGTSLNGAQMKTDGKEIMAQCIEDLKNYVDGSEPLTWIIG